MPLLETIRTSGAGGTGSLEAEVIEANALNRTHVPAEYVTSPLIAVILPGPKYLAMLKDSTYLDFTYHALSCKTYNLFSPLGFDAESFVDEAIAYCTEHGVQGVVAFDCFPTMLAAIVRQELGLPGPSFHSVLLCINKYYMRRMLTPDFKLYEPDEVPGSFPVVVKMSDTQFYCGTTLCYNEEEWRAAVANFQAMLANGGDARKRFYFRWAERFGVKLEARCHRWEDVRLLHTVSSLTINLRPVTSATRAHLAPTERMHPIHSYLAAHGAARRRTSGENTNTRPRSR